MKRYFFSALSILIIFVNAHAYGQTPGSVKWHLSLVIGSTLPDGAYDLSSPAIGPDGTIYVAYYGDDDDTFGLGYAQGSLYAINPDGTKKWELPIVARPGTGPAVDANGTIYVVTDNNGTLYSIRPNGTINWSFNAESGLGTLPGIDKTGVIYAGGEYFRAINPDGSLKWDWDAHPPGIWSGIIDTPPVFTPDRTIIVGWNRSGDDFFCKFSPGDTPTYDCRKIIAHEPGFDDGFSVPMVGEAAINHDGTVYFSTSLPHNLIALDTDWAVKWRVIFENWQGLSAFGGGSPVIGVEGNIYVSSEMGLFAINSNNGAILWRIEGATGTPAIGNDGTIYIKGNSYVDFDWRYFLMAIDADGTIKWKSDYIGSFPGITLSSDGTIYVVSEDGNLYAFHSDSEGIGQTPWPMYRHDPSRTGQAVTSNGPPAQNEYGLQDAIFGLRILCNFQSIDVQTDADVNGDGSIGIEEVVFILQKLSAVR
jgi:outer membrane protein assembly factor BamB